MITLIKKKAVVAILISHEVDHRANKYYWGNRRLLHNGKGINSLRGHNNPKHLRSKKQGFKNTCANLIEQKEEIDKP